MFFSRARLRIPTLLVTISIVLGSCARQTPEPRIQILAVLPFENQSPDANLNWIATAEAEALVYDLAGAKTTYAMRAQDHNEALAAHATRIAQGFFTTRSGKVELHTDIEDVGTGRTLDIHVTEGGLQDPAAAADAIAQQFDPFARHYSTHNARPFELFAQGDFTGAIAADANYSSAYLTLAETLARRGDSGGALRITSTALGDRQLDAIDRARLNYLAASIKGDASARIQTLSALRQFTPSDPQVPRARGELNVLARNLQDALRDFKAEASIDPRDASAYNQLGYLSALTGDLQAARENLRKYQQLIEPNDANALDSLGEVNFFLGDFTEAEKSFRAAGQKNPASGELLKAAEARLVGGDVSGADSVFAQYLNQLNRVNPLDASYEQARWQFLTGRRKAGMAGMQRLANTLKGDAQSLALAQLSMWSLQTGDIAAAKTEASDAFAVAASPRVHESAAVSQYLASGSTQNVPDALRGLGLLLQKRPSDAAPLLERAWRAANPLNDGQIRTLYAWALVAAGRPSGAQELIRTYPIPLSTAEPLFASLVFPRFLYLRAVVIKQNGKSEEAARLLSLYRKYSGDMPEMFGEEGKALSLLGN